MPCMKCGRDLEADHVFCQVCREDMQNYPVKPGTVVLLPHYVQYHTPKRQPKRIVPMDEQLRRAKKRGRICFWLMTLFLTMTLCLGALNWSLYREYKNKFATGQNYSPVGSLDLETASTKSAELD